MLTLQCLFPLLGQLCWTQNSSYRSQLTYNTLCKAPSDSLKSGPKPSKNSLVAQMMKNLPAVQETRVQSMGQEDPLEKGMATHASILAWKIPWTEEPGGLQPMGFQRAGHDWVANTKPSKQKLHEFRTMSVSSDQAPTGNTVNNQGRIPERMPLCETAHGIRITNRAFSAGAYRPWVESSGMKLCLCWHLPFKYWRIIQEHNTFCVFLHFIYNFKANNANFEK